MGFVAGGFLIVIGFVMLLKPRLIWKISDSWKTKNGDEPNEFYLKLVVMVGILLILGGILAILENLV
ncbi:hypothetical protein GCM10023142_29220 [Anaerocolumna aminovalerica]|jgi:uncharacterized membrane protein HdeD (DUF308 family)|uniref:DUF6199 domain-containing protein n=1 Tax=Anaerocolumna aminovalerica TaxID=1527 RepID=A0A1I5IJ66_9FIRM|nr:DUF6199 family natural product biosynthesis protein [Anaerocolumna aminovalerica]MBU5333835.1 hypothetical protein [Anaerocolumna aminovalerica]MDU6266554.1 hypothetical protein [Anaerocolumna aminovalerica]SFO60161.1 hypothetical protein SAMN04489757_14525 [Anaerocolumna aminovalerica]